MTESKHCRPGDITLTRVPGGYLLGRILTAGTGVFPWAQILTVGTYSEATWQARALARRAGTKVWVHQGGDYYDPLPEGPVPATTRAAEN